MSVPWPLSLRQYQKPLASEQTRRRRASSSCSESTLPDTGARRLARVLQPRPGLRWQTRGREPCANSLPALLPVTIGCSRHEGAATGPLANVTHSSTAPGRRKKDGSETGVAPPGTAGYYSLSLLSRLSVSAL